MTNNQLIHVQMATTQPRVLPELTMVSSGDVNLAVYTWGDAPTATNPLPVVVMVHGFPDTALLWVDVAERLKVECYVIAYDVRGAGQSTPVGKTADFKYAKLTQDLFAVIDVFSPNQKVHLVGHDWGGLQGWDAVFHKDATKRIETFSAASPSLDQIGLWMRKRMCRPTPRNIWQLLSQLVRNSLMMFFALPFLPKWLWQSPLGIKVFGVMMKHFEGITLNASPEIKGDAVRALAIYRANLFQHVLFPKKQTTDVRVQSIIAVRDPFLPPTVFENTNEWSTQPVTSVDIDASHWSPISQPQAFADAIKKML